jgi:hypothetical protein
VLIAVEVDSPNGTPFNASDLNGAVSQ